MRRVGWMTLLGAGLPVAAAAQPVAPLQQNPIERTAPPASVRVAPPLEAPPIAPLAGPAAARQVRVATATVSGNSAVPEARLEDALKAIRGQDVTFAQIDEARIGIVSAYRQAGYSFAGVDVGLAPSADGAVDATFQVTEGYIAEVRLEGDIGPAGTQVLRFLESLTQIRPVTGGALERALLLASDIPGVSVRGVVRPLQSEPGALQLVAQVQRKEVSGYVNLDNRGADFAGPLEALAVFGTNSFTEFGERIEIAGFGAENATQYFLQGSVEGFIGGSGLRLRVWGGAGTARPGTPLAAIGYRGETQVAGAALTYPLWRRRPFSLFLVGQFDGFASQVSTNTGGGSVQASRDDVRSLRAGLDMQALDDFIPYLPLGITIASLRLHQGLSAFGATRNGDPLSARAASQYDYSKVTFELQRTQPLFDVLEGWHLGIQGLVAGQYTRDVLPQVEKFYLGGSRLNRGFYAGQVTGDRALSYGLELQLTTQFELPLTPPWGLSNTLGTQFYLFRDEGWTRENVETDLDGHLASHGLGVRLSVTEALQFDIEGVRRDTRRPAGQNTNPLARDAIFFRTLARF
jgi:hemolysin activation/secretion protein